MKTRNLVLLAVGVAVVAALAVLRRREGGPSSAGAAAAGRPLAAFDPNAVARIEAAGPEGTAVVARAEAGWKVETLYGYPADFDKVASGLLRLAETKTGQVMPGGTSYLADFGLAPSAEGQAPTVVTLSDAAGAPVLVLRLGSERMAPGGGYPDGQYVRAGDGPVVLLAGAVRDFPAAGAEWIEKQLVSVSSGDAETVAGSVSNTTWRLRVKGYSDYELEGLPGGGQVDPDSARRAAGALSYLNLSGVADPAKADADTGLDAPSVFTLRTKEGFSYTVHIGAAVEGGDGRYVRLAVAYDKPAPPVKPEPAAPAGGGAPDTNAMAEAEAAYRADLATWEKETGENEKKAAEQQALLGSWTYIVPSYAAESMLLAREGLIKKPEPPPAEPEPPAAGDVAPAGEASPGSAQEPGAEDPGAAVPAETPPAEPAPGA